MRAASPPPLQLLHTWVAGQQGDVAPTATGGALLVRRPCGRFLAGTPPLSLGAPLPAFLEPAVSPSLSLSLSLSRPLYHIHTQSVVGSHCLVSNTKPPFLLSFCHFRSFCRAPLFILHRCSSNCFCLRAARFVRPPWPAAGPAPPSPCLGGSRVRSS